MLLAVDGLAGAHVLGAEHVLAGKGLPWPSQADPAGSTRMVRPPAVPQIRPWGQQIREEVRQIRPPEHHGGLPRRRRRSAARTALADLWGGLRYGGSRDSAGA